MVAIGLLDIPPEIQLRIAEFAQSNTAMTALSITCRSLRSIAQSVLFETLHIDLGDPIWGSTDALLANPRICTAVRFFQLSHPAWLSSKRSRRREQERLSIIKNLLPQMVGLRTVAIYGVTLSSEFMDAFLEIAIKNSLRVDLGWSVLPPCNISVSGASLRILYLSFSANDSSIDSYLFLLRASATTLMVLNISIKGGEATWLEGINLPCLLDLTISLETAETANEVSRMSVAAFTTAQRTIQVLDLRRGVSSLPLLPDVLPHLQELHATAEQVKQLVPGRPVEAIYISCPQYNDQDWLTEAVAQSTAMVRKLYDVTVILDARIAEKMVMMLPALESLVLSILDDALLKVVEAFTSLKYLTNLYIDMCCRGGLVDRCAIKDIATNLRKANSCFTSLEIAQRAAFGSDRAAYVWNEELRDFTFHQRDAHRRPRISRPTHLSWSNIDGKY